MTPAAGSVAGEGFINTTNRSAMVWDGNSWVPIVAGALLLYPTDADCHCGREPSHRHLRDVASVWQPVRQRSDCVAANRCSQYPTAAALLADSNAPEGSLGVAEDEETFWVMHGGAWHCHSRRPVADVQALAAWLNPPEGSTAMEQAHELRYHFHTGQWRPESIWVQTQANIMASQDRLDGQMAVASDTGNVWVWHSGQWIGSNIRHYAAES